MSAVSIETSTGAAATKGKSPNYTNSQTPEHRFRALLTDFTNSGRKPNEISPKGWNFSKKDLIDALNDRVIDEVKKGFKHKKRDVPDQGKTNYCGPAAFLYCLLKDRPDIYADFAISLWQDGRFDLAKYSKENPYEIKPGKSVIGDISKVEEKRISKLDWMMMASLSEHSTFGITTPKHLREWFQAAGAPVRAYTFHSQVRDYIVHEGFDEFRRVIRYYNHCWIVLEVNPSILSGENYSFFGRHWVTLNKKVKPQQKIIRTDGGASEIREIDISMSFVTWGRDRLALIPQCTEIEFSSKFYGAAAFGPIP